MIFNNKLPAKYLWIFAGFLLRTTPLLASDSNGDPGLGHLIGRVLDSETGEPVGWVQIQIKEAHRSAMSDENGNFKILNIVAGQFSMSTFRIGYRQSLLQIRITAGDTLRLSVFIKGSPLEGEAIVVEGERELDKKNVVLKMSDKTLRQNLGKTVAETVSREAGMDQRSMGPAPARPVLRGLSGDRLLVLEDGGRTGDLSATSTDHAVVIDPIISERIEVIRGPASLLYGSNTLGGVINVERGYVPATLADRIHTSVITQGETVNRGYSAGFVVSGPYKNIGWHFDGSLRNAGDISTPSGQLTNTGIQTYNASAGFSYLKDWGYTGISGSYYQSEYGVPGGFVGAHPNGVKIKLDRKHFEGKLDLHFEHPMIERTELRYSFSKYFHQEFESNGSIGTQFSVLNYDLNWLTKLKPVWKFGEGDIGLWSEYRDYVPGGFIFTPDTKEFTFATFLYENAVLGNWKLEASARMDHRIVHPSVEEQTKIGHVRNRSFTILSGSALATYHLSKTIESGISIMRSARTPGIEELFSQGPHLASYSFEVGNPELKSENGWSLEWFARMHTENSLLNIAWFRNDIRHYIFPRNTGAINIATQLPIYQYSGMHAVMTGGELALEHRLPWLMSVSGTLSYVQGVLADSNQPLPAMPPLTGKVELKKQVSALTASVFMRAASDQKRVARFENPTNGYVVFDATVQYYQRHTTMLHTVVLAIENIGDTKYRRHLSRVRSIMPEPGRNIKLLYKVFF
jgi:iron complex outermembrane receptor protein